MKKVPKTTIIFLLVFGVIVDAIQFLLTFIPVLGWIINSILLTPLFKLTEYMVWKLNGVDFRSTKRIGTMALGTLVEVTPILNALPACTLSVIIMVSTLKAEEVVSKAAGKTPEVPAINK